MHICSYARIRVSPILLASVVVYFMALKCNGASGRRTHLVCRNVDDVRNAPNGSQRGLLAQVAHVSPRIACQEVGMINSLSCIAKSIGAARMPSSHERRHLIDVVYVSLV